MKQRLIESFDETVNYLDELEKDESINSILILSCRGSDFFSKFPSERLNSFRTSICGAFFPAVFSGADVSTTGTVCIGFEQSATPVLLRDISKGNLEERIDSLGLEAYYGNTMFLMIDGMSGQIENVISDTFNTYGFDYNYFGGGAGNLPFDGIESLFVGGELVADAALFLISRVPIHVGVKHGWQSIEGPLRVTKAIDNIIYEIDYRNAFDAYKHIVDKRSGKELTKQDFFSIAKSYPLGIPKLDSEVIVREVIEATEEGALVSVGEVHENSLIHVMHGTPESLFQGVVEAKNTANKGSRGNESYIMMYCISRFDFLGEKAVAEISHVVDGAKQVCGACVLGEIASEGQECMEFYNKTCVVCRVDDVE